MKNDFYIYALYRDVAMTDPFYIGKGRANRLHGHEFPHALKKHTPKNCAIKKLLRTLGHIPKSIIIGNLTEEEAFQKERELIIKIGRIDLGTGRLTNTTDGGNGIAGLIHTAEHRAKNSAALKGRVMTPEHRTKIGLAQIGKIISPEQRAAISARNKGRPCSEEAKAKKSAKLKGRIFSEQHRANLRVAAQLSWIKRKASTHAK